MSDLVKEEEFFHLISGQGREVRSVSRSSSRSDRVYMNTSGPTYQNHLFESEEWWGGQERERGYRHRVSTVLQSPGDSDSSAGASIMLLRRVGTNSSTTALHCCSGCTVAYDEHNLSDKLSSDRPQDQMLINASERQSAFLFQLFQFTEKNIF